MPITSQNQPMPMPDTATDGSGIAELTHLGLIRVAGVEAAKFLQSQLTQDVALLGMSEARLAAFCNAKGRMQASFVLFKRSHEEVLMVCSRDILAATLKRLSMFVLRAKARLSDASNDFVLHGMAGNAIESIAGGGYPAWAKVDIDAANLVFLYPGAGHSRAIWCAPTGTPPPAGSRIDLSLWQWLEVRSGVAMITGPIVEAFVPQMLNYESVGGVSFRKGCYPGQEVVARSQYRGTLKRRAMLLSLPPGVGPALVEGLEVFHDSDPAQPAGLVALAARGLDGEQLALVELKLALAESPGELRLGAADGPALRLEPLPYLLADND